MEPFKRILCPTDFSEPSYDALDSAAGLCRTFGATLYVVHVLRGGWNRYESSDLFGCKSVSDLYTSRCFPHWVRVERTAWAQLEEVRSRRLPRDLNLSIHLLTGNAADEILRTAVSCGVDLIVMPANSWTAWHRLLFGSVTDKVLHQASCPVLLVKPAPPPREEDGRATSIRRSTSEPRPRRPVSGTTL